MAKRCGPGSVVGTVVDVAVVAGRLDCVDVAAVEPFWLLDAFDDPELRRTTAKTARSAAPTAMPTISPAGRRFAATGIGVGVGAGVHGGAGGAVHGSAEA